PCPPLTGLRLFLFSSPDADRDLHSFPTRRSSDLAAIATDAGAALASPNTRTCRPMWRSLSRSRSITPAARCGSLAPSRPSMPVRSEEHTSELQSHLHLVCRLLLVRNSK